MRERGILLGEGKSRLVGSQGVGWGSQGYAHLLSSNQSFERRIFFVWGGALTLSSLAPVEHTVGLGQPDPGS